jgi:hypothetical protein
LPFASRASESGATPAPWRWINCNNQGPSRTRVFPVSFAGARPNGRGGTRCGKAQPASSPAGPLKPGAPYGYERRQPVGVSRLDLSSRADEAQERALRARAWTFVRCMEGQQTIGQWAFGQ